MCLFSGRMTNTFKAFGIMLVPYTHTHHLMLLNQYIALSCFMMMNHIRKDRKKERKRERENENTRKAHMAWWREREREKDHK